MPRHASVSRTAIPPPRPGRTARSWLDRSRHPRRRSRTARCIACAAASSWMPASGLQLWPESRHLAEVVAAASAHDEPACGAWRASPRRVLWGLPLYRTQPATVQVVVDATVRINSGGARHQARSRAARCPTSRRATASPAPHSIGPCSTSPAPRRREAAIACADAALRMIAVRKHVQDETRSGGLAGADAQPHRSGRWCSRRAARLAGSSSSPMVAPSFPARASAGSSSLGWASPHPNAGARAGARRRELTGSTSGSTMPTCSASSMERQVPRRGDALGQSRRGDRPRREAPRGLDPRHDRSSGRPLGQRAHRIAGARSPRDCAPSRISPRLALTAARLAGRRPLVAASLSLTLDRALCRRASILLTRISSSLAARQSALSTSAREKGSRAGDLGGTRGIG